MSLPLSLTAMLLAVFLRPRDEGLGIKFVHFQCFMFFGVSEIVPGLGYFARGYNTAGAYALVRVLIWAVIYTLLQRLRRNVAKLPDDELSDFCCRTVLIGGISAMAPMIFFTFETLSCELSHGLDNATCENTSNAGMCLSVTLAIITGISIGEKAYLPKRRGSKRRAEKARLLTNRHPTTTNTSVHNITAANFSTLSNTAISTSFFGTRFSRRSIQDDIKGREGGGPHVREHGNPQHFLSTESPRGLDSCDGTHVNVLAQRLGRQRQAGRLHHSRRVDRHCNHPHCGDHRAVCPLEAESSTSSTRELDRNGQAV